MMKVIINSVILGALMTLTIVMSRDYRNMTIISGILYVIGIIRVVTTMKNEK
jgi:hypothetical protein